MHVITPLPTFTLIFPRFPSTLRNSPTCLVEFPLPPETIKPTIRRPAEFAPTAILRYPSVARLIPSLFPVHHSHHSPSGLVLPPFTLVFVQISLPSCLWPQSRALPHASPPLRSRQSPSAHSRTRSDSGQPPAWLLRQWSRPSC